MANCVTCKARCENAGQHRVKTDCVSYISKDDPKPKTNHDRIRNMTDEKLADELLDLFAAFYAVEWPKETLIEWLRQEAE